MTAFNVVTVTSQDLAENPTRSIQAAIETVHGGPSTQLSQQRAVVLPSVTSARVHSPQNTSASVIRGAVATLKHLGMDVSIGGNPPKALPGPQMVDLFEKVGVADVALSLNTQQLLDQRTEVVPLRSGRTAKFFAVAQYLTGEVSTVLVPRLRPDDLLMFGAVRGSTSGVPGFKREEVRLTAEQVARYSDQLVDLTEAIAPALVVLETGLEDFGVLVGASPYAVDMVAAALLHIDPASVGTIAAATARGLGPTSPADINVIISSG